MSDLAGKTVVVVGAGSVEPGWGNGNAAAVSYARSGANLVSVDFNLERAETTAELVRAEGGSAIALAADATSEDDLRGVLDASVKEYGAVDVLHNNVGAGVAWGPPDECAPEDWHKQIRVSLTTAYLATRVMAPHMIDRGSGAIVNISSTLSVRPLRKPVVAYSAAKAGLEAMTRACALAYGPKNVRVNCIRIGFAETALMKSRLAHLSEEDYEKAMFKSRRKVPLRAQHTDPFSIGSAAVFLASDAAKHITGMVLNVDGGLEVAPI